MTYANGIASSSTLERTEGPARSSAAHPPIAIAVVALHAVAMLVGLVEGFEGVAAAARATPSAPLPLVRNGAPYPAQGVAAACVEPACSEVEKGRNTYGNTRRFVREDGYSLTRIAPSAAGGIGERRGRR